MHHVYAVEIETVFTPAQKFPTFGSLVSVIIPNLFVLSGLIAFLFLIFGGMKIILSAGGDSKSLGTGKTIVTRAILGLLVIIFSYWIVQVLGIITGINQLGGVVQP